VWRTALHQKRPYLHLGDAIRALKFIMDKNLFDKKVYNVLTTNSTVNDIVEVIKSYVPDIKVQYVDSRIMNQLSYTVSAEKFKSLGFTYNGTLRDGIEETVKLLAGVRRISKD
jgi:nucleoside-diphosphate-sugar epimerase